MKKKDSLRQYCAQPQEDDGIDPRRFFKKHQNTQADRKTQQLCRQVYRILSLLMPGSCDDPFLRNLMIFSVTPAPDAARLLVTLQAPVTTTVEQLDQIMIRLERIKGRLRQEVVTSIHRRRAPDLVFQVQCVPGGAL